jgi:hypothetical protein
MFNGGDPNSAWSRRYHDLFLAHADDIGGIDVLSEAQISLCRRGASIECELERCDAQLSRGEFVDAESYARCASHLRRLFETLGLQRQPRFGNGVQVLPPQQMSPFRASLLEPDEESPP